MGGCRCTYRNCTVKTDGKTHMFHYPVFEKVRCHQWLVNAQRLEFLDLKVSQLKNRVVCQHHFKEENFMNYKKDKLTFDAIPTENGPFCDPSKFVDSSQEMTKSYPNLILLEDIENEVIFNDKKANFSLKYGDFLTNGEVMDSTSRYHSDNINLSKENTNIISKPKFYLKNEQEMNQQLFKPRFTTLTLPSKSVSKMQPQPMLIVPPYTDLSLDIEGGKEIIQEQGTINIYEPNPSSYKNNTRNANSLLHLNTTPSQHNNEVLVKKEPKVKILSEKKIEIRGPIPVMGKLEKVPHSITINIPNRKKEENISDKKGINNPLVKIPSDKLKILEVLDVEFNGVPKTDVATEVPKPKTIETDINYVPASQPLPKTPQIKNKITSERSAAIEKKRKFNMRMKDILETCLDKLDDSIKVNDKNPPPVKASSKSLIKQPQPKVTDQQVGTHLAKEQTLPNAQEYTIAYLDARMKSMERALLNKIEQNSQRILELKDSFGNIKTCKEPNDKKNVSVQTSINEDCYKKFLYQEMSQYLSPDSNSLIYEELFINKYSVVDTSPQRKRRRKYIYKLTNSKKQDPNSDISYFSLFKFATKWDKLLITVALVAIFIAGVTMPYAIALVANVFQNMIDYAKSSKDHISYEVFLKSMHDFGIKYTCVGLVLFTGGYLGTALMNVAAINQIFRIRFSYLKAVLNQDLAYYDLHQTGDFASKMAEDMIKLEEGIGDKVSSLVYDAAVAVSCTLMALIRGWKLALLCLSTAPITFVLVGLTGKISDRLYKKQAQAKGKASAVAEEALSSIKTVYAFNGQEKEIDRYKIHLADARRIHIQKEFFTGLSMGFLYLCIFSSYALAFYLGIHLVINEPQRYNADVMFSVFFGVMTALSYFGMIGNLMTSLGSARGAGASIFHVLHNIPTINTLEDSGIKPDSMEGNIEFKNVSFDYPSRPGITVLHDVNINISSGQSVALVGKSGCGKSTIVALISRYYDVADGSVKIDGNDVRELSVRWLRSQIGLVNQEPVLFNTSIRENIRYGHDVVSDVDIIKAAQQAYAHDFIMMLPSGYDTLVGDRGTSLSGGQKQRIAIARALVRNPRILLLDEATSALDTLSESKVQEALNEAVKGRTTVIVAHRLSTIRKVDMIYMMEDGLVVEWGSHEELMNQKGLYYKMFRTSEFIDINKREMPNDVNNAHEPIRKLRDISKHSVEVVEDIKEIKERSSLSFWQVVALNAPEWKTVALGSLCSIIGGFAMPLFIVAFGDLFGSMANPDPEHLLNKVKVISFICICIGCATGLSNLIETYSFGSAGAYLTERLRLLMFTHLLRQDIAYFDDRANSTGALCARLSAEAAFVQGATGQRIGIILQGVGSVGLALVLALWFQWRVALVALSFLPIIIFVIWQQGVATDKESSGYAKALENSTKIAVEAVSNIRTVACLGRERCVAQQYADRLYPALAPARRAAHWRGIVGGLSRSMFNFVNATALTYGGQLIVTDGIAYQNILIATQALQMASSQVQNAFAYAPDFQKGTKAAARILELLNTKPLIMNPDKPVDNFKASGDASFRRVNFEYPNRPNLTVLRGLDLEINRGKTIAIVGQSGCGKSTVVQLLQRYYDPDAGAVLLDDVSLNKLRLNDVRASFGLVSQEPVLFDRSILKNIAYGDNSRIVSVEDVIEAAKQAHIHNFIVSLPRGYETEIGMRGVQLSGGQKQRVAIARALVRHPCILLLDEATSALDNESQKLVQAALDSASVDRTCVLIAHRLTAVRDAHKICVLHDGCVAELGTHEQLIQLRGLYSNLVMMGL